MTEVGRFRTVDKVDLRDYEYNGDRRRASAALDSLRDQGLVETHRVRTASGARLDVVVLSEHGRDLANRFDQAPEQRHYSGLVKPREVEHAAAINRTFQAEAERIRAEGGEVTRVVLDHELQAKVFGALERKRQDGPDGEDFEQFQVQTASANGLRVVDRKIPLPDLRIEFPRFLGAGPPKPLPAAPRVAPARPAQRKRWLNTSTTRSVTTASSPLTATRPLATVTTTLLTARASRPTRSAAP